MSFRFETHLNVPLKGKMKGIDYEQVARYAVSKDLSSSKHNITHVKQDGDKLIIVKRIATKPNLFFKLGLAQKGFYERITIDRSDNSVSIDSFEHKYNVKTGPYVWRRELFKNRDDEPHKLMYVSHLLWVNQCTRMKANLLHYWNTMRLRSKVNQF